MKIIVVLLQSKSAIAIKDDSAQNVKQATSPSYIKAEVIQWETAGFAQQLLSPTCLITRKIPKEKKNDIPNYFTMACFLSPQGAGV